MKRLFAVISAFASARTAPAKKNACATHTPLLAGSFRTIFAKAYICFASGNILDGAAVLSPFSLMPMLSLARPRFLVGMSYAFACPCLRVQIYDFFVRLIVIATAPFAFRRIQGLDSKEYREVRFYK